MQEFFYIFFVRRDPLPKKPVGTMQNEGGFAFFYRNRAKKKVF